MSIMLLYSPFPSLESARAASRVLVEQGHVACCNVLPVGESHYMWEGAYTTANEVILIAKTTTERLPNAREALAAHHPYECPAILSFPALANPEFAAWVAATGH